MFKNFIGHFTTITKHKITVTILCFKCGLYKQGIKHDLSKYSLTEFLPGVKYFQGDKSPISKEKEIKGMSFGWLHHKGRNKHHWEYWIDNSNDGFRVNIMPDKYIYEMWCDRVAACKTYQKDKYKEDSALKYFLNGNDKSRMGEDNANRIYFLLDYLAKNGEKETIHYIKKRVKIE